MSKILPIGHTLRLPSTPSAEKFSADFDLRHVCNRREITLLEPAELRRPGADPSSPLVQVVVREWEKFRHRQFTLTGMMAVPEALLPLAQAIERLKAAA